jgi:IS30 family transposase
MDCIESVKHDKSCLLTLIDRQGKECLVFKLRRQTQDAVLRRINGLERKLGAQAFREKFKTITLDNGSEFLDWERLEQSVCGTGKRTAIYYAHAYSSWERGSVENLNGFIRYFIPKGTMIKKIKEKEIKRLEEFINNYPRRILGGVSANMFLQTTG